MNHNIEHCAIAYCMDDISVIVHYTGGEVFFNQGHLVKDIISLSPLVLASDHTIEHQAQCRDSSGYQKVPENTSAPCFAIEWVTVDIL